MQPPNGIQTWAIVSDEPTGLHTFDEYCFHFDGEEVFPDDKAGAFQLETSTIRDAEMLTHLGLVLTTATLFLVSTGTQGVANGWRAFVDAHWQRGLSDQ